MNAPNACSFFFLSFPKTAMERIRVGFVGAGEVGKSAVIHQFVHHNFLTNYEQTIEDYFEVQRNGMVLEIADLSGSLDGPESTIRKQAIAHCHLIVYMFAVDCSESLSLIPFFWQEDKSNIPLLLVANKMDSAWQIHPTALRQVESMLGTKYFPVSAKQCVNIDQLFDQIVTKAKSKSQPSTEKVSPKCCILL